MIVGQNGPAVVISAQTAYYLERLCKVADLRQRLRDGLHQEVSQELLELRHVAMSFDPSQLPEVAEVGRRSAEVAPDWDSRLMRVAEVADLLGMTDRGVRQACTEGRLEAQQVGAGRQWQISREAYENFRAARAA